MSSAQKKVFVAMSGGVDSSVAVLLLQKEASLPDGQGYDVTGVHMVCWEGCENNQDKQDAMRVAARLDIQFLVWDFRKEYKEAVFNYMISEYRAGRTPNPDVMCNKQIKFGAFLERALVSGADYIATGHYVKIENPPAGRAGWKLKIAKDFNKDQSYFLWTLTRNQLQHCLFPIGDYLKSEVRELARKFDLPTSEKKDSQGLCFVGKVDFQDFLRGVLPTREGEVLNSEGDVIGHHDGAEFFTVGQRHGLNIGGMPEPIYVAERDVSTNTLVVAKNAKDPILYKKELAAGNLNWVSGAPEFPFECLARIRYRQQLQKCIVQPEVGSSEPGAGSVKVFFNEPQRAVAPGQSVVFYEKRDLPAGRQVLGGGIIK